MHDRSRQAGSVADVVVVAAAELPGARVSAGVVHRVPGIYLEWADGNNVPHPADEQIRAMDQLTW